MPVIGAGGERHGVLGARLSHREREENRNVCRLNPGDSWICGFSTRKSEGWILRCAAAFSVLRCLRVSVQRDGEEVAGPGMSYP